MKNHEWVVRRTTINRHKSSSQLLEILLEQVEAYKCSNNKFSKENCREKCDGQFDTWQVETEIT